MIGRSRPTVLLELQKEPPDSAHRRSTICRATRPSRAAWCRWFCTSICCCSLRRQQKGNGEGCRGNGNRRGRGGFCAGSCFRHGDGDARTSTVRPLFIRQRIRSAQSSYRSFVPIAAAAGPPVRCSVQTKLGASVAPGKAGTAGMRDQLSSPPQCGNDE
jgi:hypothetical protein